MHICDDTYQTSDFRIIQYVIQLGLDLRSRDIDTREPKIYNIYPAEV